MKKDPKERLSDFELAEIYQDRVFLVKINGKLHCYNGKYFYELDKKLLETSVLETLRQELRSESIHRVRAVASVLNTQAYIDYTPAEYDGWIGFANGVWNINSNIYFEHANPAKGLIPITHCFNDVSFYMTDNLPPTPQLDRFFDRITGGNSVLIQRIWEMIGYILTPDTNAKAFFLLQGEPHSGKSILGRFLESFFMPGKITALDISRLGGQFLPDSITNSWLNLSMDLQDKPLTPGSIANIKMMTGGDRATQEAKYKDAQFYRSHCKLLFSTNHKLKLREKDHAFLERIICIPFRYAISRQEQDTELLPKLLYEKEAAAMKALFYYKQLRKNKYQFSGTDKIFPDIEYQIKPHAIIREFIDARCEFVPYNGGKTYTQDLFDAYKSFCQENGYFPQEIGGFSQLFSAACGDRVFHDRWREEGKNINGYLGVILVHTNDCDLDEEFDTGYDVQVYIDAQGRKVFNV